MNKDNEKHFNHHKKVFDHYLKRAEEDARKENWQSEHEEDIIKEVLFKAAECLRGPMPSMAGCELCEHVLLRAVNKVAIEIKGGEGVENR